jgi:hypothetical protein
MKWHLVLLVLLLLPFGVSAQEEDWPVVERCIGDFNYPSVPPSRWDFEGTIVSLSSHGLHAIKATEPQQYFIALESPNSYPSAGSLSPEGKRYAYSAGRTYQTSMTWSVYYVVEEIIIVSTDGRGDAIRVPWYDHVSVSDPSSLPAPVWLSPTSFLMSRYGSNSWQFLELDESPEFEEVPTPEDPYSDKSRITSPDGRYVVYDFWGADDNRTIHVADLETEQVYDLCLERKLRMWSTMYSFAWSPDSSTIAFTYDGYPILLNIETMEHIVLRYRTREIVAWLPEPK